MSRRDLERGPQGDHGQDGTVGPVGPQGPQGAPGQRERSLWPTLRLIAFILVAAAAIWSAARTYVIADEARQAVATTAQESLDRRDQICDSAEREHLRDVNNLKQTYLYLANLSESELQSTFNRFIIAQVPQTEEKAHTDVAPDFCDETLPNGDPIGLPEPDPVVPPRPERIDELIHQLAEQRPVIQQKNLTNSDLIQQRRPH